MFINLPKNNLSFGFLNNAFKYLILSLKISSGLSSKEFIS
jgi:hypothetical protein